MAGDGEGGIKWFLVSNMFNAQPPNHFPSRKRDKPLDKKKRVCMPERERSYRGKKRVRSRSK